MKLFHSGRAVTIVGVIGLCAVIGAIVFGAIAYRQPPQSYTPEEIAEKVSPINLNEATAEELLQLPGINKTQAQSIVAYREEHGAFTSVEEVLRVKGIGKTTYDKIVRYITV